MSLGKRLGRSGVCGAGKLGTRWEMGIGIAARLGCKTGTGVLGPVEGLGGYLDTWFISYWILCRFCIYTGPKEFYVNTAPDVNDCDEWTLIFRG